MDHRQRARSRKSSTPQKGLPFLTAKRGEKEREPERARPRAIVCGSVSSQVPPASPRLGSACARSTQSSIRPSMRLSLSSLAGLQDLPSSPVPEQLLTFSGGLRKSVQRTNRRERHAKGRRKRKQQLKPKYLHREVSRSSSPLSSYLPMTYLTAKKSESWEHRMWTSPVERNDELGVGSELKFWRRASSPDPCSEQKSA